MKSDLDSLMQDRNLDALLVLGPGQHNPAMVYLTGGAHLTDAYLIKKRGGDPVLFHRSMERDEASRTGLQIRNLDDFRLDELLTQFKNDELKATVARYQRVLEDIGLKSGRIAICGKQDSGASYAIFSALQEKLPEITLVGELGDTLLANAMATKDQMEVDRIRRMGVITINVVAQVREFLTSHRVKEQVLVNPDGTPLTIGEVKNRINLWLAESGVENPEGTIFSIGYDSAVPHSSGSANDYLRLGQTIIFDIFPCEAGGGYHYDFTRTWCLGFAPDEVLSLYEEVLSVYRQVMDELSCGIPFKDVQRFTCELFEAQGHPTIRQNPLTTHGYVHSVGHGLGLQVHERPFSGQAASDDQRLDPGVVATIEPGLYYPERNMGVRLEDTIWVRPDGGIEILADYPLDLILPLS